MTTLFLYIMTGFNEVLRTVFILYLLKQSSLISSIFKDTYFKDFVYGN